MEFTRQLANDFLRDNLVRLKTSTDYKKTRLVKIREAEDMMLGKVKPKLRQQFNVPLPVLSGLFDTLCADLDDPLQIKVKSSAGKSFKAVKSINEAFQNERKSLKQTSRWDYKDRISRKYAIGFGRGILNYFTETNPYKSILEAVNPRYFHCQPRGGGLLERHLFVGEEGIIKTKSQLEEGVKSGIYDEEGVKRMIEMAGSKEYQEKMSMLQDDQMNQFKALGLDPDANNYVGETTFNLCQFQFTSKGDRWYQLFDPWTKSWIRTEKLVDVFPSGYYSYTSYATHEDDENFWSLSILADILYPIASSIVDMFNQELTNRNKRNLNAKFYDQEMIKNVGKLDEAQYRPDAIIPVNTFGGTRPISAGVFQFETPELTGTIDLISWLTEFTGKQTGIYQDVFQSQRGKRTNNIVFAEIQQLAKRTDYRSHAYTECWGELMLRYIDGLKDLSQDEAISLVGVELGYEFKDELKKIKLDKDNIQIISTKQQNQEDALRKQQKAKSLEMTMVDPGLNPDWRRRHILSDVGGWEQEEVDEALDLRGMGGERDQFAMAEEAIKDLLKGKQPDTYWNATLIFSKKILEFASSHRMALGDQKFSMFIDYVRQHNQIVMENMAQLALRLKATAQIPPIPVKQPAQRGRTKIAQEPQQPSGRAGMPQPAMVNLQ